MNAVKRNQALASIPTAEPKYRLLVASEVIGALLADPSTLDLEAARDVNELMTRMLRSLPVPPASQSIAKRTNMTKSDIEFTIQEIKDAAQAGDNEKAHSLEDQLCRDFIDWAARAKTGLGDLVTVRTIARFAKLIASTKEITFERICA